jgi:23S rRNA (guanosine2251-2'-O)-methyltransferase
MNPNIILISHNLRSTHNVGSLFRTAEGLGVSKIYLTGYTPYPLNSSDLRLPHISAKINKQISKTALDAEKYIAWEHIESIEDIVRQLKNDGYAITALEQAANSVQIQNFRANNKQVLIVGREVEGIEAEVLNICDSVVEIPMFGRKESFNVVQASAMALYHIRFSNSIMLQ